MFKKILVATLFAATANAGELKFDFRADAEGFSANDASGKPGYSKYYLQTARLDYKGKVDDNTSFRARLRLNKDLEKAVDKRDSANGTIDFFMVKTALAEGTALVAGRFQGMAGGYENLTPGSDTYFKSTALGELSKLAYYTGFGLEYKASEAHLLTAHVTNQDTDETAGTLSQKKSTVAVGWEGTYAEGNYKSLVTYTTSPKVGSDVSNTFLSAGLKMKFDSILADLEYLSNTWTEKTVADENDVTTSIVGQIAMKGDAWTPKLKVESSTLNVSGTKAADVTGLSLIGEYKPVAENDLRYHIGVNQLTTKPVGADAAIDQTIIAGIKLGADFLK